MIIRFRSKDGMFRINTDGKEDFEAVLQRLVEQLPSTDPKQLTIATQPNAKGESASALCGQSATELGLKHGDLLFATYPEDQDEDMGVTATTESTTKSSTAKSTAEEKLHTVKQLRVDNELEKEDGKITRSKDTMCRHGDKGMCDYCMPLEPFDQGYLEEHNIKHASFNAHLRQLNADKNKTGSSSSYMAPLSEPDYRVSKHCPSGHAPWPAGICSKCQPSAITLQRQTFRMVDHVEFASFDMMNNFINAWRQTGTQRIGWLYGRYEKYEMIPLGIKAVVEAIYEPPQSDESDGVTLTLPWGEEEHVDKLAEACGLQKIGVVYTDLTDSGQGDGTVICKRHVDSYFLTSLEVCFSAELQSRNPNPSRWSDTGQFSSKFVTCVISGNKDGGIDISSYQVTASAEAMTRADLIEPSANPSVVRIKQPNETRYVPEIFYKRINEYKRAVNENAKPAFPVEYLLITLTHGFPEQPQPMFQALANAFPIENRAHIGVLQDLGSLKKQLGLDKGEDTALSAVSDFHLLTYICSLGILSTEEEQLLVKTAISQDVQMGYQLLQSNGWQTLLTIIREST